MRIKPVLLGKTLNQSTYQLFNVFSNLPPGLPISSNRSISTRTHFPDSSLICRNTSPLRFPSGPSLGVRNQKLKVLAVKMTPSFMQLKMRYASFVFQEIENRSKMHQETALSFRFGQPIYGSKNRTKLWDRSLVREPKIPCNKAKLLWQ